MPEKITITSVGGSVEKAVKGEYSIDVKSVLSEAWSHTQKSRMSINLALFSVMVFGIIVSYISSSFFGGIEVIIEDPELLQLINVIVTVAVWPFIAGIEMMGIAHALNKPTQTKMIFSFLHRGSWVALCALLTSLIIGIGVQLFLIPGVILAVLLSLTAPLVIEKNMTPVQAVVLSIKSLRFKLLSLLSIYAVLLFSFVSLLLPIALLIDSPLAPIGIMAFLFGLSYLIPWYYNVKGILYRDIFGVFVKANTIQSDTNINNSNEDSGSDDTFVA